MKKKCQFSSVLPVVLSPLDPVNLKVCIPQDQLLQALAEDISQILRIHGHYGKEGFDYVSLFNTLSDIKAPHLHSVTLMSRVLILALNGYEQTEI